MKITRRQIRKILKEALNPMTQQYVLSMLKGRVGAGPNRGTPWADLVMQKMQGGRYHEAANAVMDALMIDDPPVGADDELAQILSHQSSLDQVALAAADWGTKHFRSHYV